MRATHLLLAATALAAVAGCSGGSAPAVANVDPPAGQDVTIEVRPSRVWVAPGGTVDFTSLVTGTADTSVTWEVIEPGGGTVSATGTYSAPLSSGTYTVSATTKGTKSRGRGKVIVGPTPTPTVAISPTTATVAAASTFAFSATVTGTTSTAVAWSVREASGCGSIDAAGVYTAPAAGASCHVIAASVESPTATDEVTVTVSPPPSPTPTPTPTPTPVVVAITPSSGAVDACRTLAFTASVSGTSDGTVIWSVQEGSAGGTITPVGVYTAPASAGTYHVVATSQASPTSITVAAVTVSDRILGVTVTPSTLSLAPGATAQFTATVTSTCGSVASTQTVTAPN